MTSVRRPMRVLGLMSGTSADGIDVALVRISGAPPKLTAKLEGFFTTPYPPRVRAAVLRLANGAPTTAAEASQLNFLLGELFARTALAACRRFGIAPEKVDLIGSHGQTVYHQGSPAPFAGARVASTLQLGEPAVIAERTGITTVADFRPADIAAGGQGAPLVPFVDNLLYRHARQGRIALNIGGIANVTVIPAGARPEAVFAFDTGPGNMVVDALVSHFTAAPKWRFADDSFRSSSENCWSTLTSTRSLRKRPVENSLDRITLRGYFERDGVAALARKTSCGRLRCSQLSPSPKRFDASFARERASSK
jgi:anhydro-N-acetylmuramic acid kinase